MLKLVKKKAIFQKTVVSLFYNKRGNKAPLKKPNIMTTYKNTTATNTNSEVTNVLFAQGETMPTLNGNWIAEQNEEFEIEMMCETNCTHLFTISGVKYFGTL